MITVTELKQLKGNLILNTDLSISVAWADRVSGEGDAPTVPLQKRGFKWDPRLPQQQQISGLSPSRPLRDLF